MNRSDLHAINILLFYPYGTTRHYGEAIAQELTRRGGTVTAYDERPSQSTLSKIFIRLFKRIIPSIFNRYIRRIVSENQGKIFDYIIVLRGEAFTLQSLNILKSAFPQAKTILYLWDILRTNNLAGVIDHFDRALTFDPEDAKHHPKLKFRPTFFLPAFQQQNNKKKDIEYDIAFTGTLHSNRHKILRNLFRSFEKQGFRINKYLFVPSRIVFFRNFIAKFPYVSPRKVHFRSADIEDILKQTAEAQAVLDINYTAQKSLSMRAYESMAAQKKYITTNPEVVRYDFYDPRNILIIDLKNPHIDPEWIDAEFRQIPSSVLYKYSVPGFVDALLDPTIEYVYWKSEYSKI